MQPAERNRFLLRTAEKEELNQYWFSAKTIQVISEEVVAAGGRCACISTPSVYFSLPPDVRATCKVFDLDMQWEHDPGFVKYDFNAPLDFPDELRGAFAMVVVDPPFITRDVWEKYAVTVRALLAPGGKILLSTIAENADMMAELLDVRPRAFQPSIPHLVYQYNLYTNYESEALAQVNAEVPQ